jgi:hypothetical protein
LSRGAAPTDVDRTLRSKRVTISVNRCPKW